MKTTKLKITGEGGLHARPASLLVSTANKYQSSITLFNGTKKADAKSIMNIMALHVNQGDEITIEVNGSDEVEAFTAFADIVKTHLQ